MKPTMVTTTMLLILSLSALPIVATVSAQTTTTPTIVSLYFSEDGTGWLTVDYYSNGTISPVTGFNHTLTEANGYMWNDGGVPFFINNRTQVPLESIDFSTQIILDPRANMILPAKPNFSQNVLSRYAETGESFEPEASSRPQSPAVVEPPSTTTRTLPTEDWNPLERGPIPTPPPTTDPDLIRFNELFQQCKTGQDKIASLQGNSYDHNNQDRCIFAMKDAIATFCDDFQTFDAAKCSYVNRPDVILFLEINDRIFGFGETPSEDLGGLLP
jgi:hypothetical protein